jgi:putative two-component system response regulator
MGERARVLIVDDEPQNLAVLARVLAPEHEVLIAPSGARALELARGPTPPDLVLLDVVMPGLDGYEVLLRLQADPVTRELPVLFVSGLDTTADEERGLALGAVDYLAKPYRAPIIRARVATHLALKRARDALAQRGAQLELEVERRTRELQRATAPSPSSSPP